jgi:heptosyltransferase-2
MTFPALRALRSLLPDAHITLATRSTAKDVFIDADCIDEILIHDRSGSAIGDIRQQARQWGSRRFDLAILFPNSFAPALVARLARIPVRIGYRTERRGFLLSHGIDLPEWRSSRHETFYYLNIIARLAQIIGREQISLDQVPEASLSISGDRQQQARSLLTEHGVRSGKLLVALCPGSINSRAKRWPAERYAELAEKLQNKWDADVVLIGSAAEVGVSREVARQMKTAPILLTGQTDLASAVSVLSQVDLLITNDTGPAHIAAALGRPTLVIFGPTNPLTTRPLSATAEILRVPPDCAPCMLRDCPIDHRCMTAITPDMVFDRAEQMLRESDKFAQL